MPLSLAKGPPRVEASLCREPATLPKTLQAWTRRPDESEPSVELIRHRCEGEG